MDHEVLRVCNIDFQSEGRQRLSRVNLLLMAGKAFGMIGRNGSGKNALANVLTGALLPDSGTILLEELPADRQKLRQSGILIVRNSRLLPSFSVTENLLATCPAGQFIWHSKKMRVLCQELLVAFGLESYIDVLPNTLPPAIQHRLLLVRAVLQNKKFVVLESTAEQYSLLEQEGLLHTIRSVCSRGLAVLYASRCMDFVQHGLSSCAILSEGRIVKVLQPQVCDEQSLYAYQYGFHAAKQNVSIHETGRILFSLPNLEVRAGSFLFVSDPNGTADRLITAICDKCSQLPAPAILNEDALDHGFINSMTVIDNILLTAAPRTANFVWHVSKRMQRFVLQECTAQTGITQAQLFSSPVQLTRSERLRLLLYRCSLLGARIFVIDRPGADESDRTALEAACTKLLRMGCAVIYITNSADEPFQQVGKRLIWQDAKLKEEII